MAMLWKKNAIVDFPQNRWEKHQLSDRKFTHFKTYFSPIFGGV